MYFSLCSCIFFIRCQVSSNKTNLAGGTHVNSAVIALFAALVWHTQPIRESLESYSNYLLPILNPIFLKT